MALCDLLVDEDLQGLVARVLVHVERVAVLGDLAVGGPLAGLAVQQGVELDHVGAVADDGQLVHTGGGGGQAEQVGGAELEQLGFAIGQIGQGATGR